MSPQQFFTGFGLLSVSLAMHGSVFFTMDHAASYHRIHMAQEQRRLQREKDGPIQFEFVETPRAPSAQKSLHSRRISSRDALNQDLLQDKTHTAVRPHVDLQGHADQLAQKQGSGISQVAASAVGPHLSSRASEPQKKLANESRDLVQDSSTPSAKKQADSARNDIEGLIPANSVVRRRTDPPSIGQEGMTTYNPPQEDTGSNQPRVEPKPKIQGPAGVDKITTQEMSKIRSPGARLFGQTSFEATGSGMGEYMKNLKERIWLAWFPYLAYQYPQDFRGADVIVSFTLDPKGQVKIVQLVDSVGSPVFASYCIEAVQRASGFGPVPKEILALIGKDELEIKFGFHYR